MKPSEIQKEGWVYALADSASVFGDDITDYRYVGYSTKPEGRLKAHIASARRGEKNHRCNWIRKLLKQGRTPVMLFLEKGPEAKLPELEIKWIADLKQCCKLVNGTIGGDGVKGYKPKPMSLERRKAQSILARRCRLADMQAGKTLGWHTPAARKKAGLSLRGYKHSDETKKAFSLAATKRFTDPIERLKISKANKGRRKSEEHKRNLAEAVKLGYKTAAKVSCPTCGLTSYIGVIAMHRKNKKH